MKIDSHQHFWIYDAQQYPWIPGGSQLQRNWLPADLECEQAQLGLEGSIAVQARQTVEESWWLLQLADRHSIIKGVVGWVDLRSKQIDEQLEALAKHPKFVGVRHVVQDEPDDRFLLGEDFIRGLARLPFYKLTYDLLIFPRQLPAAIELVAQFPDQPFVLDHIAKPLIREGKISPWREQIRELAQAANVWCKVSGMITEANHQHWSADDFKPYLDVVFECFGVDRLMFGSDWPVCLLSGNYEAVFALVRDYAAGLTENDREKLFGANAARFYGLA
jgi:L-fuconolactonase